MRRKVKSLPKASPVDGHERTRDYLSEEEFALLLQGTPRSRYRWRNAAMLMLTFYHGLRVTELCRLESAKTWGECRHQRAIQTTR